MHAYLQKLLAFAQKADCEKTKKLGLVRLKKKLNFQKTPTSRAIKNTCLLK